MVDIAGETVEQILARSERSRIGTCLNSLDQSIENGFLSGEVYEISSLPNCGRINWIVKVCAEHLRKAGECNVLWISCVRNAPLYQLVDVYGLKEEELKKFSAVRVTSFSQLFIYLKQLTLKQNTLLVIQDLSFLLNNINRSIKSPLVYVKSLFRDVSNLVEKHESTCLVLNSLKTVRMQFTQIATGLKVYDQVLVSSMDVFYSGISQFIRCKMVIFKDWVGPGGVSSTSEAGNFINIVNYRPKFTDELQKPVICFKVTENGGIAEVEMAQEKEGDTRQPFVLEEGDLESDLETEATEEDEAEQDNSFLNNESENLLIESTEISQELEELFPTQPESISQVYLSQIESSVNKRVKR